MNAAHASGATALAMACVQGHVDIMRILHDHGASLAMSTHRHGWTPLHLATLYGQVDAVRLILGLDRDGALLEKRASHGTTALHIAAGRSLPGVLLLLLRHGADIDATDNSGLRPHDVALRAGALNTAQLLESYAAGDEDPRRTSTSLPAVDSDSGQLSSTGARSSDAAPFAHQRQRPRAPRTPAGEGNSTAAFTAGDYLHARAQAGESNGAGGMGSISRGCCSGARQGNLSPFPSPTPVRMGEAPGTVPTEPLPESMGARLRRQEEHRTAALAAAAPTRPPTPPAVTVTQASAPTRPSTPGRGPAKTLPSVPPTEPQTPSARPPGPTAESRPGSKAEVESLTAHVLAALDLLTTVRTETRSAHEDHARDIAHLQQQMSTVRLALGGPEHTPSLNGVQWSSLEAITARAKAFQEQLLAKHLEMDGRLRRAAALAEDNAAAAASSAQHISDLREMVRAMDKRMADTERRAEHRAMEAVDAARTASAEREREAERLAQEERRSRDIERDALVGRLAALEALAHDGQTNHRALEASVEELRAGLDSTSTDVRLIKSDVDAYSGQTRSASEAVDKLAERVEATATAVAEERARRGATEAAVGGLERELHASRAGLENVEERLRAQMRVAEAAVGTAGRSLRGMEDKGRPGANGQGRGGPDADRRLATVEAAVELLLAEKLSLQKQVDRLLQSGPGPAGRGVDRVREDMEVHYARVDARLEELSRAQAALMTTVRGGDRRLSRVEDLLGGDRPTLTYPGKYVSPSRGSDSSGRDIPGPPPRSATASPSWHDDAAAAAYEAEDANAARRVQSLAQRLAILERRLDLGGDDRTASPLGGRRPVLSKAHAELSESHARLADRVDRLEVRVAPDGTLDALAAATAGPGASMAAAGQDVGQLASDLDALQQYVAQQQESLLDHLAQLEASVGRKFSRLTQALDAQPVPKAVSRLGAGDQVLDEDEEADGLGPLSSEAPQTLGRLVRGTSEVEHARASASRIALLEARVDRHERASTQRLAALRTTVEHQAAVLDDVRAKVLRVQLGPRSVVGGTSTIMGPGARSVAGSRRDTRLEGSPGGSPQSSVRALSLQEGDGAWREGGGRVAQGPGPATHRAHSLHWTRPLRADVAAQGRAPRAPRPQGRCTPRSSASGPISPCLSARPTTCVRTPAHGPDVVHAHPAHPLLNAAQSAPRARAALGAARFRWSLAASDGHHSPCEPKSARGEGQGMVRTAPMAALHGMTRLRRARPPAAQDITALRVGPSRPLSASKPWLHFQIHTRTEPPVLEFVAMDGTELVTWVLGLQAVVVPARREDRVTLRTLAKRRMRMVARHCAQRLNMGYKDYWIQTIVNAAATASQMEEQATSLWHASRLDLGGGAEVHDGEDGSSADALAARRRALQAAGASRSYGGNDLVE